MATRTPPRFVPTLTEVVQTGPAPLSPAIAVSQDQLAQRLLQRVDLALERRLRETIATVILEQTAALAPLLRDRIEVLVRDLVAQAVAEEIEARQRGSAPGV
ncbi:hypothetical protein [Ramlibacter sp.]|jgi:hypothetical protein|uniref:hypothetical protein n=1 Tax=Ramlibacter sp. TaxID=1917967 RepID=UPI0026263B1E|nr:hypothetical protein [Ramlibacter sp.]MDB5956348.1 hypothetical protein [Ramlibacter sp.]